METDRDYHIRRARDELDLAYRTTQVQAASAHMRLCALHIGRLHDIDCAELTRLSPSPENHAVAVTLETIPELADA